MAEPGAVSWQFERKGVVMVPKSVGEDELMLVALDAGGEDLEDEGDEWMLTSAPTDLAGLRGGAGRGGHRRRLGRYRDGADARGSRWPTSRPRNGC